MTSRWLISAVAAGCIGAAGLGGYFAARTTGSGSEVRASGPDSSEPTDDPAVMEDVAPTPSDTVEPAGNEPVRQAQPVSPPVVARAEPSAEAPQTRTAPSAIPRFVPPSPSAEAAPADIVSPADTAGRTPVAIDVAAPAAAAPAPVLTVPTGTLPVDPDRTYTLPAPPAEFIQLAANTVIGIRLDTTVSSETARVEDEVRARVTRPVEVDGRTVIPTGARLVGYVTDVDRGGRVRGESRIGIRFTQVEIDRRSTPVTTEPIYREGQSPTGEATAKIGASTVVGSILGGVFGGKRGAVIGGAAGAAGGTAMVVRGDRNEATFESGTPLTVRLAEAAEIEITD